MSRAAFLAQMYGIMLLCVVLFFVLAYVMQTYYEWKDNRRNKKFAKEMKELTRDFL